jgi:hypothetical protein
MRRILAAAVLAAAASALAACGPPKACTDAASAYQAVKPLVLAELTAPSSASFPPIAQTRITPVNDCEFLAIGYVDSRADPAHPVRTYYTAHLRLDPKAGRYAKLRLEFSST